MSQELNNLFKQVVLSMYGTNCVLCKKEATTVHHLYEKGMGGASLNVSYNPLNGVPVCHRCHDHIHNVVGEVVGRELVKQKVPTISYKMHEKYQLQSETKAGIAKELRSLL